MSDFFFPPVDAPTVEIKESTIVFVIDQAARIVVTQRPARIITEQDNEQRVVCVSRRESDPSKTAIILLNQEITADQVRSLMVYLRDWQP